MSYLQLRYHTHRDRADELTSALEDSGALSVTWENAGDNDYLEIAHPRAPSWRRVCVTGLFDSSCKPESVTRYIKSRLKDDLVPQVKTLEQQDWERAYRSRIQPRRYRGDLWVCPSWVDPPDPEATVLVIDPGLAFGTGDHPTTAMCLDWVSERQLSGKTVLDYGCGSGILAIACLLKGAAQAIGADIDPRALSASVLNAERNNVAGRYQALTPKELPQGLEVDIVIANILSNVLAELSGVLTRCTRKGGKVLLTGILEDHANRVMSAFEPSFTLETQRREGWCLLIGQKR